MIKESDFLPIECLSKIKLETQKSYPEWLGHKFKSKALSDALPSKIVSTLIKVVRFRLNHGQLECKHQTSGYKFGPFVSDIQATYLERFHRQLMQT